jgi:hypothetical protein
MVETILSDARAQVAAGRDPDWKQLRDRVRSLDLGAKAERDALRQLEQVGAVYRARRAVARPATPPPASAPRKPLLVTKPTISGTMEVRRPREHVLEWSPLPTVEQWEVRISERPNARRDYEVRSELTLPAATSELALELGDKPIRVHLLGRSRGGKLVQRAVISGLTEAGWSTRWERRASAS